MTSSQPNPQIAPNHPGTPRPDIGRLMKPRSIAIVGISPDPGNPGSGLVANLKRLGYAGEIHLVSRNRSEVNGRLCVATIDLLPEGIDVAVLIVPRVAIEEAVAACARRRIGAVVVFAAGFAEAGGEWKAAQDRFAAVARANGIALCGPNCLGIINYVDNVVLTFTLQPLLKAATTGPGVAVIAQSGGLASVLRSALQAKGLTITFYVSTGNEAVLGREDYIGYVLDHPGTRVIVVFAEQIRDPERFLRCVAQARALGKPVVVLHPGRSDAARASAQSHTGALAGDYATMKALTSHHGAVMVESLEELIDVSELIARFPEPPTAGAAVVTDSGAFKGMALDQCEQEGLDLPALPGAVAATLQKELPDFIAASNPLDLTAQGITQMDLYQRTLTPLIKEPTFGSVMMAGIISGASDYSLRKGRTILNALAGAGKPVVFGMLGDDAPLPPQLIDEALAQGVPVHRSPERGLRALARFTAYGRAAAAAKTRIAPAAMSAPPLPGAGTLPEHLCKTYLGACGIPVPRGMLAGSLDEARGFVAKQAYPVALKLQARKLSHKSDAGAVILQLRDDDGLRTAWKRLEDIATAMKLEVDGILVEAMAAPGVEMIVGGKRDPEWGPVVVVGLGGIWAEALKDARVLPADLSEAEIETEIRKLKGARILGGMRGMVERDVQAVARIASTIGALLRSRPEIREIDLNPVSVYARGEGALALDALIVTD